MKPEIPMEVPAPIKVKLGKLKDGSDFTEEITFKKFLTDVVDSYTESAKLPKQIRQREKVIRVIEASNGHLQFEDADFELVKGAVEAGGVPYQPVISRQLVPYLDALALIGIGKE